MTTAAKIHEDENAFARDMGSYIKQLRQRWEESPETAYREASESLRRSGVADENGKVKDKIVSWE